MMRHVRSQHATRYQQGGHNYADRTAWCGAVLPDDGDYWGPVEDLTDSPVPLANCPACLDDGTGTCRRCGGGLPPCAGCDHHAYSCDCTATDPATACPMCAAYEQSGLGISDDELAAAEAAGTICDQCAEVVTENRAALA